MDEALMKLLRKVTPEENGFLNGRPVERSHYALEQGNKKAGGGGKDAGMALPEARFGIPKRPGPAVAGREKAVPTGAILEEDGLEPKGTATNFPQPAPSMDFIIDSAKMLERGELLRVRPHSRFVEFPDHRHSYVEIMYMCSGATTHIIDAEQTVRLEAGDLLFLNQHAVHRILPAGMDDIGVNFMVLPQFFDQAFSMLEGSNILREFIVDCLREEGQSSRVLHFKVADLLPVQNLVENMIWTALMCPGQGKHIQPVTMGLLFLQLVEQVERIEQHHGETPDRGLAMQALRYIQEHYRSAALSELAVCTGLPLYHLSRVLKRETGATFKDLLRRRRLDRACELLEHSDLPVCAVVDAIGYSNTSYFYREFEARTGMSPGEYRRWIRSLPQNTETRSVYP